MDRKYTARLENWSYNQKVNVIVGDCFGDKLNRFQDGSLITTSRLRPMSEQVSSPQEGAIMATLNSAYLLGSKK